MDKIDEILIGTYKEKCLRHTNSTLFPIYSGGLIFSGALLVALINQKTSYNDSPFFPYIVLLLIFLTIIIVSLTFYYKAKYEEYNRKYMTFVIKELAANSIHTQFEEAVKEIAERTLFDEEDVKAILFRLLTENG